MASYCLKLKGKSTKQMEEFSNTARKALSLALKILSHHSCTSKEVELKLSKKGYSPADISSVINYCKKQNYLNDEEFAIQWISNRKRFKPMGRSRLKQELKQKGIDRKVIYSQLDAWLAVEDEFNLAAELIYKKLHGNYSLDEKKKLQLYRLLLRRGFNGEIALSAMAKVINEAGQIFPEQPD